MRNAGYRHYEPLNTPRQLADDLWTVEGPVIGYRYAGVELPCPTRMTVVRLPGGGLWLHSPIALHETVLGALKGLGDVAALVSPNSFHHTHIAEWAALHQHAEVFAPPRMPRTAWLPERTQLLSDGERPPRWRGAIETVVVDGGAWSEAAFLHRPTRTLILTDLVQNFETGRVRGKAERLLLRLGGAAGDPPAASLDMRLGTLRSGARRKVRRAFARITAWAPSRVLIAHGRQPDGDPIALLNGAFRWAG